MPCSISQKGLTLVEVLVGIVIGMLVILTTGSMLILGNKQQLSTVASSNLGQDTTFIHNLFDQKIRSAGTGFLHGNNWSPLGCNLNAENHLPLTNSAPKFLGDILINTFLPLSPVLISDGIDGNHNLIIMGGSQQNGGTPQEIINSNFSGTEITVNTTLGLEVGELIIINSTNANQPDCHLARISSIDSNTINLSPISNASPSGEGEGEGEGEVPKESVISAMIKDAAFFSTLGHLDQGTSDLSIFGLATNDAQEKNLVQFKILNQEEVDTLAPYVVAMYAIYGIDDGTGKLIWEPPTDDYSLSEILKKSKEEKSKLLRSITAVRISLLFKNPHQQPEDFKETSFKHFEDLDLDTEFTTIIPDKDSKLAHHLLEFSVPLKNSLFNHNLVNPKLAPTPNPNNQTDAPQDNPL